MSCCNTAYWTHLVSTGQLGDPAQLAAVAPAEPIAPAKDPTTIFVGGRFRLRSRPIPRSP